MAMYQKCNRIDCFGNKCGARCDILVNQHDTENCSFFKTDEQLSQERAIAHKHLKMKHREDLIKKYEYNPQRRW